MQCTGHAVCSVIVLSELQVKYEYIVTWHLFMKSEVQPMVRTDGMSL